MKNLHIEKLSQRNVTLGVEEVGDYDPETYYCKVEI